MGVFEFKQIMFALCLPKKKRILERDSCTDVSDWINETLVYSSGRRQEGRLWRNNYMN